MALLAVAATLALPAAAHARERIAALPSGGSPNLALAGERVLWAEPLPTLERGAHPVAVRIGAARAAPATLIVFPGHPGDEGITVQYVTVEASTTHVAIARRVARTTGMTMQSSGTLTTLVDELWAGPIDGPIERIASCDDGGPMPSLFDDVDVSGSRVAHQTCGRSRGLVVRDLSTGASRTIVRGGLAGGRHLDLAGRFLAWEERREEPAHGLDAASNPRTLVVHDLDTGGDAYRVEQPRIVGGTHGDVYIQDDGRLLDPKLRSDTEIPHGAWYSASDPTGNLVLPGETWELIANRTLSVHRPGDVTTFTVHGLDGRPVPVARAHAETLHLVGTDADRIRVRFDGERVAWTETRCGPATIYTHRVGEPLTTSRSFLDRRCARAGIPKRPLRVAKGGGFLLPVACVEMRRCAGIVRVTLADGTTAAGRSFDFGRRSRGVVRLTLAKRARRAKRARFEVLDRDRLVLADRAIALRP